MFQELIEQYGSKGVELDDLEKIFHRDIYKKPAFQQFVYDKLVLANPTNCTKWLKKSLRYLIKSFSDHHSAPAITARRVSNSKRSVTMKKKCVEKQNKIVSNEIWENFDKLTEEQKEVYFQKAKDANPGIPEFLVNSSGFLIYAKEQKQDES